MSEFYRTAMGQRHYTATMPSIAKSLRMIAEKLDVEKPEKEKVDPKLLTALEDTLYLAEARWEEMKGFEDADTVGHYLEQFKLLKKFIQDNK